MQLPTIWLIEDNPADIFLIEQALGVHGVAADLVVRRDGQSAFELIGELETQQQVCPRLIILDLNLPKRSGQEIFQRFRVSGQFNDVPVVIVSSSDAPSDQRWAVHIGVTRFFRKPSSLEEFMKIGELVNHLLLNNGQQERDG
ncbi:MAG TPA: response regulator [Bryobacteraceae bacterium]|nr:response regulator [Bryobacteraceae bacterium]